MDRHALLLAAIPLVLTGLACSFSGGGGQLTGTSGGTSGGSSGGTSGGTSGTTPPRPGVNTSPIDGQWDITAAGSSPIGASQMTIGNGVITGALIDKDEGRASGACVNTKERAEFKLSFEGESLSGTITKLSNWTGPQECNYDQKPDVLAVTGRRTVSRQGATSLEGEWEVNAGNSNPFIVEVTGLTAKAWDKQAKANGREASANVSVAGGNATLTSTRRDLSFAAQRR